jgi:hypothetical protein
LATLVFSTIGTALGGPVGSAIGALIGQSIDQALLAPVRRGPRVGDLSVQTSSYGTQIPRIYGTMRVAGTVVWATDLIESEQTSGAKGQPDITYSYSVSLAVALSSRPANAIGRIWADGKLLRGAAGDFKVDTAFRFYNGSDDQVIDPLIGSVEGIAATPAYRGVALTVFENLQLADFGNRIPMMTFEVLADGAPPSIGSILDDASGGAISCDADDEVIGFAAYGRSIKSAVEPLVGCFGVELFDDGTILRSPGNQAPIAVTTDELGNSAEGKQVARIQREQVPARELPSQLRLTYYDPDRDYQTGEAQAAAGELRGIEIRQDLAAVLQAGDAKALVHEMIARAWKQRDHLTLRLPPSRLSLQPGDRLSLELVPSKWRIEKITVDGFVSIAELRPSSGRAGGNIAGDSGRLIQNPDVVAVPLTVALLDVPGSSGLASGGPVVLLAATTSGGWQRQPVEIGFAGQSVTVDPARAKSIFGWAEAALASAGTDLIDEKSAVIVALVDQNQWLTSCDDEALAAGENLAVLGNELIQFGDALPLGGGRFRLSRLLRGRGGSEWACAGHSADELFCLLRMGTLQPVALPNWSIGATVTATAQGGGSAAIAFLAEALRPPTPVDLAGEQQASGDLVLSWTRRSRQGFAWIDGIDAPLGESTEQYRVNLSGIAGALELTTTQPLLAIAASDVATLGVGAVMIEVRQIGDVAVSRAAQMAITLS